MASYRSGRDPGTRNTPPCLPRGEVNALPIVVVLEDAAFFIGLGSFGTNQIARREAARMSTRAGLLSRFVRDRTQGFVAFPKRPSLIRSRI